MAKLRKKVVVTKRFWKINAIRPEIKAIKGKNEEVQFGAKSKLGGLVKKLGFLFVTQILLSAELAQPWCAATPIAALGP